MFFFFGRDSWNKERSEKDELLKNGKLQLSQQQARAQEAEVSCRLGMIDFLTVTAVLMLRNFDGMQNLEQFSSEYPETKTEVITLTNHKGYRHYSEPIKTQTQHTYVADA